MGEEKRYQKHIATKMHTKYVLEHPEIEFDDGWDFAVLGKFKDETNGSEIQEFIGFRAMMYSIVGDCIKARAQQSAIFASK